MDSPSPKTQSTKKITMTEEQQILQRKIKAAARKQQQHAQKQQCPIKHDRLKEKTE